MKGQGEFSSLLSENLEFKEQIKLKTQFYCLKSHHCIGEMI